MKIKVLHIVGGYFTDGAYKGVNILHKALVDSGIDSKILNDKPPKNNFNNYEQDVVYINNTFFKKLINIFFINLEKILKTIFLPSPRSTFTLGFFGFDITRIKEYQSSDIIHIHWLGQGFVQLKSLSKINKPVVWTMRDMWPFTGGSHYNMDFEKYEKNFLSKIIQNYKKKKFNKNIQFVAISNWLKNEAKKSYVLKDYDIKKIYNNINLKDFELIDQNKARSLLKISTKKQVILYGAQNPQSKRKGWDLLVKTLKKLDKSKYYLLIFGKFWSQKTLDDIGIDHKTLGFIDDKKILNAAYSSADIYLSTSIQEAFGKTWAEAMACETPVICFKNTPSSEVIEHKINGYIVENLDANDLHEGINWLSGEIMNKRDLNAGIRNKVMEFDANVIAKKYINLYEDILKINQKN